MWMDFFIESKIIAVSVFYVFILNNKRQNPGARSVIFYVIPIII